MEVVVVGAGKVGFAIAEKLTAEQHNVVVIDLRADRLTVLNEALDVMTIEGSGACGPMMEQAEIRKADLFIAVTNVDEINLVACQLAKYYGVPRRIARIGNLLFLPSDGGLKASDFGVDLFINPEQVCAQELSRLLRFQAVHESQEFCDGRVMLIALTAAALARWRGDCLEEMLKEISNAAPHDVSPAFWHDLKTGIESSAG